MSETHAPESFWEFWQRTMRTKQLLQQLADVKERLLISCSMASR